jgi:hypothetical protein
MPPGFRSRTLGTLAAAFLLAAAEMARKRQRRKKSHPDRQGAKALAPWRAAARYVKQAYDPADVFQASHPVTRGQP